MDEDGRIRFIPTVVLSFRAAIREALDHLAQQREAETGSTQMRSPAPPAPPRAGG